MCLEGGLVYIDTEVWLIVSGKDKLLGGFIFLYTYTFL